MNTTVYLIRHSKPFKEHIGILDTNDSILLQNQKSPLSIEGEKMAERWANNNEFKNLDVVISSNYVRAISTAKYFAHNNNLKVNITDYLNERVHGINYWNELPFDFEIKQLNDENYKIGFGESQKEVQNRMLKILNKILTDYQGKRVLIVSHATAITFLLKEFCEVNYNSNYKYKDKVFFDGNWNYLETFKLEFNEKNELIDISNIKNR